MNQSTVIGLLGGVVLLIGMIVMSPDHIGAFFNLPGLIVVIGGTLTATFVSRPIPDVYRVLRSVPELFRDEKNSSQTDCAQLLRFADWYRRGNLRAAEQELVATGNRFLKAGLRQVVDGCQIEDLRKSLQWRMSGLRTREYGQAQIMRSMAAFAPAFGMLGTLFGLVHMLSGLGDSGLDEIGGIMAFAMITTLYGIVASNLFFKPLAIKMERRTNQRLMQMGVLMEGILLVHERRHPTLIKEALEAFEDHHAGMLPPQKPLTLVRA
jgi:chemotaxis protein MotA